MSFAAWNTRLVTVTLGIEIRFAWVLLGGRLDGGDLSARGSVENRRRPTSSTPTRPSVPHHFQKPSDIDVDEFEQVCGIDIDVYPYDFLEQVLWAMNETTAGVLQIAKDFADGKEQVRPQ